MFWFQHRLGIKQSLILLQVQHFTSLFEVIAAAEKFKVRLEHVFFLINPGSFRWSLLAWRFRQFVAPRSENENGQLIERRKLARSLCRGFKAQKLKRPTAIQKDHCLSSAWLHCVLYIWSSCQFFLSLLEKRGEPDQQIKYRRALSLRQTVPAPPPPPTTTIATHKTIM